MKYLINKVYVKGYFSCFRKKFENKARTRGGGSQAVDARTGVSVLKLTRRAALSDRSLVA